MKVVVIGDTHFDNPYKGYLEAQISTCYDMIAARSPTVVVFLGDIFHYRKPDPETILAVKWFFDRLSLVPGLKTIYVLRGNHDSTNKSDDGLTILSILEYPGSKVRVIRSTDIDLDLGFLFVPHYENEETIKKDLNDAATYIESPIVFGHFGYHGCMDSYGNYTSQLLADAFKHRTILGHIHKCHTEGNVTILGTPWSTNFGEADYPHYLGTLTRDESTKVWSPLNLCKIESGVRHYVCPFQSLESMKDEISDPRYFTILRVLMDKFADDATNDIRSKILEEYKVKYVDLKFQPVYDTKLNGRLSDYDPQSAIDRISDDIVDKYLEEQKSSIPSEELKKGLELIKQHANQEG